MLAILLDYHSLVVGIVGGLFQVAFGRIKLFKLPTASNFQ